MKEFQDFETWIHTLELDWEVKGQKDPLPDWLKARENAAFRWAWNRAEREVAIIEKKAPLNETESVWLNYLEITVEVVLANALARHDEFSEARWRCIDCVYADFQLLARAARLQFAHPFLDKLRAEYEAGRFPCASL